MDKARIAVLVSGGGTNLQALINAQNKGIISSGQIALVISNNPNAFALKRAAKAGIPTAVITKSESGSQQAFEERIKKELQSYQIDLIVLAGFMSILSKNFTADFPERIVNVHPSLIPAFCGKGYYGLRVHEEALKYGVTVTGATVHFVNEIPDGGRIILQKAVKIKAGDTPEILQKRVMKQAEWKILPEAVEQVSKKLMNNRKVVLR